MMIEFVRTYLGPPLVGAFIGYFTNYVAIKMLFRPLTPWRILGFRLPFTPGVIPGKRHDLARNIGEMVGSHLLTSADVSRALTEEAFGGQLEEVVNEKVTAILHHGLGPANTIIPERFRSYFDAGIKVLRWRALKQLHAYIDSAPFAQEIESSLGQGLSAFSQRTTQEILPADAQQALLVFVEESAGRFLAGAAVHSHITRAIEAKIDDIFTRRLSCRDLFGEDFFNTILDAVASWTPDLLDKAGSALGTPETIDKVIATILAAIEHFIDTMGSMATVIRNFIDPGLVRDRLRTYFASRGNVLAEWILDREAQEKVAAVLREKATTILTTPIADLFTRVDDQARHRFCGWIAQEVLATITRPETAAMVAELLREGLAAEMNRPLRDLAATLFGPDADSVGIAWFTSEVTTALRTGRAKKILDELVVELVERRMLSQPLGSLAAILPREVQNSIGDYLFELCRELLIKEVPALVDSININQIVVRKVNSLDLLRLEKLLLGIMEEQFKYINLFGGILGFLIGLVNLLF